MNDSIKLIMDKHDLNFDKANLIFDLVKRNCKDEDFYPEFINELKVFHDKKTTTDWITEVDSILADALKEIYTEDNTEIDNDKFADILIHKFIEDGCNLSKVSDSLYVGWEE